MNPATDFTLDARQRAMLEEMHIKVWLPTAATAAVPAPVSAPTMAETAPAPAPASARTQPVQVADALPDAIKNIAETAYSMRAGGTKSSQEVLLQPLQPLRGDVGASAATLDWPTLQTAVTGCQACKLCEGRTHAVFGTGQPALAPATVPQVDWLLVGEAPVEDEDRQGQAFVAQPGQLLDNMLAALGRQRNAGVFVTHALKCRPPSNRSPVPDELAQCLPYLQRQVALLQPKVVLAMGRLAAQAVLQSSDPLGRLRGQVHRPASFGGVPVVVTFSPEYLLRNPGEKARAWLDLVLAQGVVTQAVVATPGASA